jgi:hypothetical protein
MKRHVWLGSDDPAVMRHWRNIEELVPCRSSLIEPSSNAAVAGPASTKARCSTPQGCAHGGADVFRPPPTGLVCGLPENLTADPHDLVAALPHPWHFVGFL